LSGYIFATKARIDNLVKEQYFFHMSPQYDNFGSLAAEIGPVTWGTPASFNGFRFLAALLQRRRSPAANQTMHDVWPSPELLHVQFRGLLLPDGILPGVIVTLRPSLAFSYVGTLLHGTPASGVSQTLRRGTRNGIYTTFAEGSTYMFDWAAITLGWALAHILVNRVLLCTTVRTSC